MNRFVLIILMVFSSLSFAIDVQIDLGASTNATILGSGGKNIQAVKHYLRVTAPINSEKKRYFDVQMIYDPKTRLFWWGTYALMESQSKAPIGNVFINNSKIIYTTGTKIVGFSYSTGSIWAIESSARYSSLVEGQDKVIVALKSGINDLIRGVPITDFHHIEAGRIMGDTFGIEFFHLPDSIISPSPKLIDVKKSKKDNNWHLIFEGVNKAKGEVILSDDYQVLDAALLPDKKHSKPK